MACRTFVQTTVSIPAVHDQPTRSLSGLKSEGHLPKSQSAANEMAYLETRPNI
jgi:hypothetical protein